MNYFLKASKGSFSESNDKGIFKISPEENTLILNLSDTGIPR
jgi:hypothetical protein